MHYRSAISIVFLCLIVSSCGFTVDKEDAESKAGEFMNDRLTYGGVGEDVFYGTEFWKATSAEEWKEFKNLLVTANGNLVSFSLYSWNINKKEHTSKLSGTFVTLIFSTVYEIGSGKETLIMYRANKSDDFTILGHNIDTPEMVGLIQHRVKKK